MKITKNIGVFYLILANHVSKNVSNLLDVR